MNLPRITRCLGYMFGDTPVIAITNGAMRWLTRRREQHAGRLPQLEKRNATTLAERDTSHPYICSRSPSPPGTDRPTRKPRPETRHARPNKDYRLATLGT